MNKEIKTMKIKIVLTAIAILTAAITLISTSIDMSVKKAHVSEVDIGTSEKRATIRHVAYKGADIIKCDVVKELGNVSAANVDMLTLLLRDAQYDTVPLLRALCNSTDKFNVHYGKKSFTVTDIESDNTIAFNTGLYGLNVDSSLTTKDCSKGDVKTRVNCNAQYNNGVIRHYLSHVDIMPLVVSNLIYEHSNVVPTRTSVENELGSDYIEYLDVSDSFLILTNELRLSK